MPAAISEGMVERFNSVLCWQLESFNNYIKNTVEIITIYHYICYVTKVQNYEETS